MPKAEEGQDTNFLKSLHLSLPFPNHFSFPPAKQIMSDKKVTETIKTNEHWTSWELLIQRIGSEAALMEEASKPSENLVGSYDITQDAFQDAKQAYEEKGVELSDAEVKVTACTLTLHRINEKYESIVHKATVDRDLDRKPVQRQLGEAEAVVSMCQTSLGQCHFELKRAEMKHKATQYLVGDNDGEKKKAFAFESLEKIREIMMIASPIDIAELGREVIMGKFRALKNLDYGYHPFVLQNQMVGDLVGKKHRENLSDMKERLARVLGFPEEEIALIRELDPSFSMLRSPAAQRINQDEKKGGVSAIRKLSFAEKKLVESNWQRSEEKRIMEIKQVASDAQNDALMAENEHLKRQIAALKRGGEGDEGEDSKPKSKKQRTDE
jgi:cell division protein FtsB